MDVELLIDGNKFVGWKRFEITRSLKALCAEFTAEIHDVSEIDSSSWCSLEGKSVVVKLGGDVALTGKIDSANVDLSASNLSVSVSGRDLAADIVDCSIPTDTREFLKQSIEDIAKKLVAPFGITVKSECSLSPVKTARTKGNADTIFAFLDSLAKRDGVALTSNPKGELVIFKDKLGGESVSLKEGEAHIRIAQSNKRFYKIVVIGEQSASSQDEWTEEKVLGVKGEAIDASVKNKSRVLVIRESGAITKECAKKRAEWEVARRLAESQKISASTHGWRHSGGGLWQVGMLVSLDFPRLKLKAELLLESLRLSIDENGITSDLEFVPPSSLKSEPEKPEKPKKKEEAW